jgi:hypothetical protein
MVSHLNHENLIRMKICEHVFAVKIPFAPNNLGAFLGSDCEKLGKFSKEDEPSR